MMSNKTIFLDIDGVLNTEDSWKNPFKLNDNCIHNFCTALKKTGAEINIVLTSSWKNGFSSIPENETSQLKELREKLKKYGFKITGRTKSLENRMQEIDEFILNHEVYSYAIIDDDQNEYTNSYLKKVTLINPVTGFVSQKIKWNKNSCCET